MEAMTVEEFRALPETASRSELRRGVLFREALPPLKQIVIQRTLRRYLEQLAPSGSFLSTEVPFRALPEHDLRAADVAYVSAERWSQVDEDDDLRGAPDLVIEVLSPSNTAAEMNDKERLCLENGSKEFWIVDPNLRQVKVATPDGHTITWKSGQQIPLPLFGNATLNVDDIFAR